MPSQTHVLNKDAGLEDSIVFMQKKLAAMDFHIQQQSWSNPITNVWSVNIKDQDCPLLVSNGKGASKQAALASALKEFFERLSTHYFWADYYLGDEISNSKHVHYKNERWFETNTSGSWPEGVLNEELQDFYNSNGELDANKLIDANSANRNRGICCLPFVCEKTQESIYFPINIIDNLYASNGISVGDSLVEARIQALTKIFENFVKFKVVAEGVSLPDIPDSVLDRYPNIQKNIKEIEHAGFSLLIQDASLGGKYPVVAVTLLKPENQGVCASFGAQTQFGRALEQAILQLLKNRELDKLKNFTEAGFDLDEVASPQNLEAHFIDASGMMSWQFLQNKADYEFVDWDNNQNTDKTFEDLCDLIHQQGNDIYVADYQELGVPCCRILVPGMSEVYPRENLVWENNNAGIDIRKAILKKHKTVAECEALIEAIEDLNLEDQYLVATLIGYPADADSIFADLCVTELITLLALKCQDNERIQEGCEWLLHYKQINPARLKVYQCIDTLLQLDGMVNYSNSLAKLYSKSVLNDALALIDGEDIFPLESDWEMHESLVDAYRKVL
ncbi:30S ribosomal protein S12 methylthiotransferase accessory factor YcaO [Cocleimonas sp. KMM 6892]|uniref:30S ribosomal protein S12 methylthiotransferase accessory factor YcaO n=1 Tax=unclassified Cocleimonas TaxID=2639732 RepID=UPI002DBAD8AB|nr:MULTISPECIES: 30S ribosomal protein S12 methylthiotransferase accessory factor YcaO [unclassified Cocleimonas]MEB8432827.1 30S ribosomal protein S12 methylthiotransferase accessory factor YcaO [Cocleimonas sp. KMM 6892]MEC4715686.1 30S ribosomal protein S12 methylthiotransferase accessory factor YcaO [Cocleimonas sp. KMM 6895]MEC4744696.1 30S ribosomal protein S12 methylthiotransferase accessory factor YcaO [Cocleimonas sp. KMM 6896]